MTCTCHDPIVFGHHCPRWKTTIATAGTLLLGNTPYAITGPIEITWNWLKPGQTSPYRLYLPGNASNP